MRLVPSQVFSFDSAAEKKVFGFLKEISLGPADVALHSLNIGRHEYKRWSEADFVLVTRRGILLLEVKGGRVACKNGTWEFTNRFGESNAKAEGPAAQASSAFFSLEKNYLKPMFGHELGRVVSGFGVVLCDVPRLTSEGVSGLPEHPDEITAYEPDCRGHNTFRDYLERVFDYWESKKRAPFEMPPQLITKVATALRPSFERVPSLDSQLKCAERDLCQFTEEQYERMDEIAENERILVSGGAGTGKTFIAAACARYEASDTGVEVLFITRNPFLASFLGTHDFPANVTTAAFEDLPCLAARHGPWDTLIVDEGQDMCDPESLDILEKALKGGWPRGRWRWFGDPNHQVSPSRPVDADSLEYLRSLALKCSLKQNVRNAGRVVDAIARFSDANVGKARGNPDAGKVTLKAADSSKEIDDAVASTLKAWLAGDGSASRSDVVVLVDEDTEPEVLAGELTRRGYRAEALSTRAMGKTRRDCVLVARIEDFKGLERPLVCIAGLGGSADQLSGKSYKAISRANHELVLIASTKAITALAARAAEIALRNGGT